MKNLYSKLVNFIFGENEIKGYQVVIILILMLVLPILCSIKSYQVGYEQCEREQSEYEQKHHAIALRMKYNGYIPSEKDNILISDYDDD